MKTHAGKKRSFLKSKATLNKGFDIFTIIEDNGDKKLYEEPQKSELEESSLSNRAAVESNDVTKKFLEQWMKRLHFITIPTYQFGNWIPLVTSRWYCSGHGCGLDQASFEGKAGMTIVFLLYLVAMSRVACSSTGC